MAKNKKTKKNDAEIESAATETIAEVVENKKDETILISHVALPTEEVKEESVVVTASTISVKEDKTVKPIEKETKKPTQAIKKKKPRIDFNYFWNGTYIG